MFAVSSPSTVQNNRVTKIEDHDNHNTQTMMNTKRTVRRHDFATLYQPAIPDPTNNARRKFF